MLLRYIDLRHSVACFKKIQVIIYIALTANHILQDWSTLVNLLSYAQGSPSVTCSGFWRISIQGRFSSLLLCEVLKRCLLHRLSQYSVPLRGRNSTEITESPHHVVPAMDPARGFRECLLLATLCFTYRAEEIQRKCGNSCYHTHVKETDLLFAALESRWHHTECSLIISLTATTFLWTALFYLVDILALLD